MERRSARRILYRKTFYRMTFVDKEIKVNKEVCDKQNKKRETCFGPPHCEAGLCREGCFKKHHTSLTTEVKSILFLDIQCILNNFSKFH